MQGPFLLPLLHAPNLFRQISRADTLYQDQHHIRDIMQYILGGALTLVLTGTIATADVFKADVWADNWFALYANGALVGEDSVPITTERSFNAESFSFKADTPLTLALIAKDFKENDTGLEYIGTRKQQMGDGGVILQIKDANGNTIAVSNKDWKCLVTHEAPISKSCAKETKPEAGKGACAFQASDAPNGWTDAGFDDSNWQTASEYSERDVSPKDGYDRISWSRAAKLIWGPDLETNNTLLCRLTVN